MRRASWQHAVPVAAARLVWAEFGTARENRLWWQPKREAAAKSVTSKTARSLQSPSSAASYLNCNRQTFVHRMAKRSRYTNRSTYIHLHCPANHVQLRVECGD